MRFAIVTISTSKYHQNLSGAKVEDESGDLIAMLLQRSNHKVTARELIPDSPSMVSDRISRFLSSEEVDVVITTGGTGVTKNDLTVETVSGLLEKELPGFGEILRRLSYERIGSAAILTRATAGIKGGKVVFCLPGSPDAVEIAVKQLIIPEAAHIAKHARE